MPRLAASFEPRAQSSLAAWGLGARGALGQAVPRAVGPLGEILPHGRVRGEGGKTPGRLRRGNAFPALNSKSGSCRPAGGRCGPPAPWSAHF